MNTAGQQIYQIGTTTIKINVFPGCPFLLAKFVLYMHSRKAGQKRSHGLEIGKVKGSA